LGDGTYPMIYRLALMRGLADSRGFIDAFQRPENRVTVTFQKVFNNVDSRTNASTQAHAEP
jgi:hypothetical protein